MDIPRPLRPVNLSEEILDGVLHSAEYIQKSILVAEDGAVECLRWSGAIQVLLHDFQVPTIINSTKLWTCKTREDVLNLLQPRLWGPSLIKSLNSNQRQEMQRPCIENVVIIVMGYLWDYEDRLKQLLQLGGIRRLTICSSLSERAHECYPFHDTNTNNSMNLKMCFEDFAQSLEQWIVSKKSREDREDRMDKIQTKEDWDWNEEEENEKSMSNSILNDYENTIHVIHLPLNYSPLLSTSMKSSNNFPIKEPSLFVLSHPQCAQAFPLLVSQVNYHLEKIEKQKLQEKTAAVPQLNDNIQTTKKLRFQHIKDVPPEHIPPEFRRTLRLLAFTLSEMCTQWQLNIKENIYTLGATSLKIGHTMLRILQESDEDSRASVEKQRGLLQDASLILVDRTCDMATPCSTTSSLVDRILQLLPHVPTGNADKLSPIMRQNLHVTEVFPIHGCDPQPLTTTTDEDCKKNYHSSQFLSSVQWNAGATLCPHKHSSPIQRNASKGGNENLFNSLIFLPPKQALREVDRSLQRMEYALLSEVEKKEVRESKAKSNTVVRGRDVVLSRLKRIAQSIGDSAKLNPKFVQDTNSIELAILVLESLERMDQPETSSFEELRKECITRHLDLRCKESDEWILAQLSEKIRSQMDSSSHTIPANLQLRSLLSLLIHGFTLSSSEKLQDFSLEMISKVLSEIIVRIASVSPQHIIWQFPDLYQTLAPVLSAESPKIDTQDTYDNEWDWDDHADNSSPGENVLSNDKSSHHELLVLVERFVASQVIPPLKECGALFSQMNSVEFAKCTEAAQNGINIVPRPLVAVLCEKFVQQPTKTQTLLPELEHIVDASEQLTRAGIDLLKSGFSRFGFSTNVGLDTKSSGMDKVKVFVVFVLGGISFNEVQEVYKGLGTITRDESVQVILGSTSIVNNEIIVQQLFSHIQ